MKLTQERYDFIQKVIDENRTAESRVKAIRAAKKKFVVKEVPLGYRSTKIKFLHHYTRSVRLQIGCPKGYMRYAWVVMFDPMPYEEVHKINLKLFGKMM